MPEYKFNDRVIVKAGVHKDKHGKIVMVSGKTASVRFDGDHGSYYVGLDNLKHEK